MNKGAPGESSRSLRYELPAEVDFLRHIRYRGDMNTSKIINIIFILILTGAGLCTGCKPKDNTPPGVSNHSDGQDTPATYAFAIDAEKYETASSVIELPGPEYLISGETSLAMSNGIDGYLVKLGTGGTRLMERVYHNDGDQYFYQVIPAVDSGFIIMGLTNQHNANDWNIYLLKVDTAFNPVWEKNYGGPGRENCNDIISTEEGTYVIAGDTIPAGKEKSDFCLWKIDAQGNLLWEQTYGTDGTDTGRGVIQTNDEGFLLTGHGGVEDLNVYFIKTDADGNQQWSTTAGNDRRNWANSITRTDDGASIAAGMTEYTTGDTQGVGIYAVKVDATGQVLWDKTYNFPGRAICLSQSIGRTPDGNYIIGGSVQHPDDIGFDLALVKIDIDGDTIWQQIISGGSDQYEYTIQTLATSDGGYLTVGYSSRKVEKEENGQKRVFYIGRTGYVAKIDNQGQLD